MNQHFNLLLSQRRLACLSLIHVSSLPKSINCPTLCLTSTLFFSSLPSPPFLKLFVPYLFVFFWRITTLLFLDGDCISSLSSRYVRNLDLIVYLDKINLHRYSCCHLRYESVYIFTLDFFVFATSSKKHETFFFFSYFFFYIVK